MIVYKIRYVYLTHHVVSKGNQAMDKMASKAAPIFVDYVHLDIRQISCLLLAYKMKRRREATRSG